MADVVQIRTREALLQDQDWVLVARTPSGKYEVSASVAHKESAAFPHHPPEAWEASLSRAHAWADKCGIPSVLVLGRKDA